MPIQSTRCLHRHGGWCGACAKMVPRISSPEIKSLVLGSAIPNTLAIALLARTFPVLDKFSDFDRRVDKLNGRTLRAMFKNAYAHSEEICLSFVLCVWLGGNKRSAPKYRFDLVEALTTLDETHRTAVASWVKDPWWP